MSGIHCCYNCTKRQIGCHGTCETYIKERKEYDEMMKKYKAEKELNYSHNTDGTMWTPPADRSRKSKRYHK